MGWNRVADNLGTIKAGTTYNINFIYTGDIDLDIRTLVLPCSCVKVIWEKDSKTLAVEYKPKPVPEHIKQQLFKDEYHDIKKIEFHATIDGVYSRHQLNIIALVKDNKK